MSTQLSETEFELPRFCRAVEGRDTAAQLAMYAPDAAVTIADRVTQPGNPRVLHGREEIGAWIEDTSARDMSHAIQHTVSDGRGAAFTEACRYPDGTNVLCATVLELAGGRITRQTVVQAWDES
jgi:SnoaL-like protein